MLFTSSEFPTSEELLVVVELVVALPVFDMPEVESLRDYLSFLSCWNESVEISLE